MSRTRQILTFLSIFALILGATHFYMFERIGSYLGLADGARVMVAGILGGFAVLTLAALPLSRILPRTLASVLSWIVYPWMGISLLLFVTLVVTDSVWLGIQLYLTHPFSAQNASLQFDFGVAALSITALASLFALWTGLAFVRVRQVNVNLHRLPKSFEGLRIVQITDLHIGPLISGDWLQKIVAKVNALQPDLIAITGDLVDGSVAELEPHVASLAELRAPHGVYFITGNHEYYSGVEEWCRHVAQLGLRVLRNERVTITSAAGESFDLAGVDDWRAHHFLGQGADLAKALAGRDAEKAVILLAHQPAAVEEAATHGVDLQVSGHTHGGQIWPFNYLVYLQQPFVQGLYRYRDTATQIYVSPGTGFWGPPMRLGTIAEITLMTLRSGR